MNFLGELTIDDYIPIVIQGHDTSGSAADLDSGSFDINFYEFDFSVGTWAAMTTPDTTINAKLDTKTGLYSGSVQATTANGFEAGKLYFYRVTGTIDSQTPAVTVMFRMRADGQRSDEVASRLTTAIPNIAAGGNGGLPTVNANNYVAGVQGTKNTLDDLNDIAVGDLNNISTSDVLSQIQTALDVNGSNLATELSSIPAANATIADMLQLIYMMVRNGGQTTTSERRINKDDGDALGTGSLSDDGTTTSIGELS